jgi:hypothetical protein
MRVTYHAAEDEPGLVIEHRQEDRVGATCGEAALIPLGSSVGRCRFEVAQVGSRIRCDHEQRVALLPSVQAGAPAGGATTTVENEIRFRSPLTRFLLPRGCHAKWSQRRSAGTKEDVGAAQACVVIAGTRDG